MRKKIWMRKAATSALGLSMVLQFLPASAVVIGAQEPSQREDQSSNQMVSAPETVYQNVYDSSARVADFNAHWKFSLGDAGSAQNNAYDDSEWDMLNLPHDYSIDQEYTSSGEAESAYLPGGTGWYRKNFTLSPDVKGKRVVVEFEGVYMNATVYLNGKKLGEHAYGYTAFALDLTDALNFEGDNVIAVKVDHKTPSSRWYSGSGIYRGVNLIITGQVHTAYNGIHVTTPNLEAEKDGDVATAVETKVENNSSEAAAVTVKQTVVDARGNAVGTASKDVTVSAGSALTETMNVMVSQPALWSPDSPALYTLKTEIISNGQTIDRTETVFGYRYFSFDNNTGFSLNGVNTKFKGVCMHHDQGALGAESWKAAVDRQVRILKEMGCNAIRVTHNPASRELLEACNEQGILVINELFDTWTNPKNGNSQDYARHFNTVVADDNGVLNKEEGDTWAEFDVRSAIQTSRNDPSVIMYSLGNEIFEGISGNSSNYTQIARNLVSWVQESDTANLITFGDNYLKNNNGSAQSVANVIDAAGGTIGYNYTNSSQYDAQHANHPDWAIYGSETASSVNSRGYYARKDGGQGAGSQLSSYDTSKVGWGHYAADAWLSVIQRDFVAGEFVWTGFDYLGEPTPWNGTGSGFVSASGNSPKNSYFGIIDTAGLPKDSYYLYQAQWNDDVNTLHVLPAWNSDVVYKDASGNVPVVVYSDAASVELFFTPAGGSEEQKVSLGKKEFTKHTTAAGYSYQLYEGADKSNTAYENLYMTWNVPYADGTITAVARDTEGNVIGDTQGTKEIKTAGAAAKLVMDNLYQEVDADGKDLAYIEIDVKDAADTLVPNAENVIAVTVEGDGRLVGLDNGRQNDYQSYTDDNRHAYSGKLVAIVQAGTEGGAFTVTASAEGLESASRTITTKKSSQSTGTSLVSLVYSKTYYVKTGVQPVLPETVKACYEDGTEAELPVIWDAISDEDLAVPGRISVNGSANGTPVSVNINILDEVGAVLSCSAGTATGFVPILPSARPVVLADGTVLDSEMPVTWNMPSSDAFAQAGTVVVSGSAVVFGQSYPVTCTVRVEDAEVSIGNPVQQAARLSQSIPEGQQSDTLSAITDGTPAYDPDDKTGNDNNTIWSNYNYCFNNPENNTAQLVFRYDTQQIFGRFTVHFVSDTWSASNPDPNTISFDISEDGLTWNRLQTTETIGSTSGYVTPYTYDFDPAAATYVRLNVVNTASKKAGNNNNPCTGISEVEMNVASTNFTTNSSADLSSLSINGSPVSAAMLASGNITTSAIKASVTAESEANAAITILPVHETIIRILTESEDGSAKRVYTVKTAVKDAGDPADASRDIDLSRLTASAASETVYSSTEGEISFALDGIANTHWHTDWTGGKSCSSDEDRWYQFTLDEPAWVDAWRYKPRSNGSNGFIANYRVEYKDANGEWQTACSGRFDYENKANWQIAAFDEPIKAQEFRLVGESTISDGIENSKHMSASEFRLRASDAIMLPEIEDLRIEAVKSISVDAVDQDHPATIEIKVFAGDKLLEEDADYVIEYKNNTAYGTAQARIIGVGAYAGSVVHEFTITNDSKVVMTGLSLAAIPAKTAYVEDECFNPAGLKVEAAYSDGTTEVIEYNSTTAGRFAFTPALDAPLAVSDKSVSVSVDGHTVSVPITVASSIVPMDPADSSRDVDTALLSGTDGSHQSGNAKQGPASYALDGDTTTLWHSLWAGDERDNLWIELSMEEARSIEALRCLPRQDSDVNGIITKYRVDAWVNGEWKTVAEGNWDGYSKDWKIAQFKPVTTTRIRLYGVETRADVAKIFASAAEVRLVESEQKPAEEANKTLLKSSIDYAKAAISSDGYEKVHPKVRAGLEKALEAAEAVYNNPKATQAEVNEAWKELSKYIQMLDMTSDKTELAALVSVCDAIDPSAYADGADEKAEFAAALANAKAVLEDENALDSTSIIPAYNRLLAAKNALETLDRKPDVQIDTSRLERLIRLTRDTDLDKYLDYNNTKEIFTQALAHAIEVAANPASQAEVDQAVLDLSNAYLNLRLKLDEGLLDPDEKADKTLLKTVIDKAQSIIDGEDYASLTPASRTALEEALAHAQEIFAKEDASQEEVDEAYRALSEAIQKLNHQSDKGDLEALIEASEAINPDEYLDGEDVKAAFEEALEHAKEVAANENATEEEVEEAKTALEEAKAALEALERKPAEVYDLSVLLRLIELTENTDLSRYTAGSEADAFVDALVRARGVAAAPVSQSQIDEMTEELSTRYLSLRLRADEALLKELAALADQLEQIEFAKGSPEAEKALQLVSAIREFNRNPQLAAKEDAEAVKRAAQDLIGKAQPNDNIVKPGTSGDFDPIGSSIDKNQPKDEVKPDTQPKADASAAAKADSKPASSKASVSTSTATGLAGMAGLFAAAGAAISAMLKKRK